MKARTYIVAAVAVLLLTAGSVVAMAATRTGPLGSGGVASSCSVPSPAGRQVQVVLADMGGAMRGPMMSGRMMLRAVPWQVPAGEVSFVVANHGTRTHELVVLPLADGATVGSRSVGSDGTVDESGSLGEASRDCGAGAGDGISPGSVGWVTLHLEPGRYELACNLPGHYAAGMFAELDVS